MHACQIFLNSSAHCLHPWCKVSKQQEHFPDLQVLPCHSCWWRFQFEENSMTTSPHSLNFPAEARNLVKPLNASQWHVCGKKWSKHKHVLMTHVWPYPAKSWSQVLSSAVNTAPSYTFLVLQGWVGSQLLGRESFSSVVQPLLSCPCSGKLHPTHIHTHNQTLASNPD